MVNQTQDRDRRASVADEVARNNRDEAERAHRKGPDRSRVDRDTGSSGTGRTLIGLGLAAATAGAAIFFARRMNEDQEPNGPLLSDAPDHVLRGKARQGSTNNQDGKALIGRTLTIGKPRHELYQVWRDFTRFPEFMDNVREISKLDETRSRWTIEAPAGATVELITRIVEDKPGETIAWVSEPDSQIETDGRVELADAPPGRGTYVRLLVRYKPPAGAVGRLVAKVLQREPNVQARRDLRRFKQLMETGEVPVNASPSARKSETPTEARI
ncbi:SRPBCC family protein [Sphingomonas sp. GCM10030256]|uniref:SRPBCC family protein n=1 Tax=Sphingomonas sp. GCM10030256 TaxID=3273427 RepID=UPI0036233B20